MGASQLDDLIAKWKLAELTPEQTIGQILLLLQALVERLEIVERQIGRQHHK
jgi:hypothetical protein